MAKLLTQEPKDLPIINNQGKRWNDVVKKCYTGNEKASGVALLFVTKNEGKFDEDALEVLDMMESSLNIACITENKPSVDDILSDFKAIADYNPKKIIGSSLAETSSYHYIFSYFSGYGGCESDGRLYVLLEEEKIYVDWIVSILKRRYEKRQRHPCILLFELCYSDSDTSGTRVAPVLDHGDNFVVAISGFTSSKSESGAWTAKLCEQLTSNNLPLTDILDDIGRELADQKPQYVSSAGALFLCNASLAYEKTKIIADYVKSCPHANGMMLAVNSPSLPESAADKNKILMTFKQLNFITIESESSTDFANVTSLIKAVSYYENYTTSNKFFAFYYSGYGGSDSDGRLYIHHGDTDSPDNTSIYIDWIVSLYNQRFSSHLPCLMLFEMTSKSAPNDDPLLLPICNNSLLAISGLNTANGGRTKDGGRWTQLLCQYISQCDEPISSILDKLPPQLPDLAPQYVNSMGFAYLQNLHEARVKSQGYVSFMKNLK